MKRLNFHITMLAAIAAVAVTAMNISTAKPRVPAEFALDLSSSSEEPARGLAGLDEKPDLKALYAEAREFSADGKFDECLAKLVTIHQEVNEFEGSRELKNFCSQGKVRKQQMAQKRSSQRRMASHRVK